LIHLMVALSKAIPPELEAFADSESGRAGGSATSSGS
jgi:hypothetical protein